MPVNPSDDRADHAIKQAQAAFWGALAAAYPEITSGDLSPEQTFQFEEVAASIARTWIKENGAAIVFTHDQLAKLAHVAQRAEVGDFGASDGGTCHAVIARQGEKKDRGLFRNHPGFQSPGFTPSRDLVPVDVDTRDMVILVDWITRDGEATRTAFLVRPDGTYIEQDQ